MSRLRKPYHHGDLRRALLEAARRLVETEGPRALSFRRLAESLDVSHAAPLAHFPDRSSLDAALAAQGFREVAARCESLSAPPAPAPARSTRVAAAALPPNSPPLPPSPRPALGLFAMRLVTAALVYLRFALEHPGLFRMMYASELPERARRQDDRAGGGEETSPLQELGREKARAFGVFVDLVKQGQSAGEFRQDPAPDQVARLVTALAEGLAHQYLEEELGAAKLREAEALLELFVGRIAG